MDESITAQVSLKADILERIAKRKKFVTFAQLMSIECFNGAYTFHFPSWPNIILWTGIAEGAVKALIELIVEKKVDIRIAPPLVYLMDGAVLMLPVFQSASAPPEKNPETPHWLPVCFSVAEDVPCEKENRSSLAFTL